MTKTKTEKAVDQSAEAIRGRVAFAIMDGGDKVALQIIYTGADGVTKRRCVSPTAFCGHGPTEGFTARCLGDGKPKRFYLSGVSEAVQVLASDMLIPMPVEIIRKGAGDVANVG